MIRAGSTCPLGFHSNVFPYSVRKVRNNTVSDRCHSAGRFARRLLLRAGRKQFSSLGDFDAYSARVHLLLLPGFQRFVRLSPNSPIDIFHNWDYNDEKPVAVSRVAQAVSGIASGRFLSVLYESDEK